MAERAHKPYIPISDTGRLTGAAQILRAAIVANDAKYVNTYAKLQPGKSEHIDLGYLMEAAHSLVAEVIAHRPPRGRRAKHGGSEASTITDLLLQALHMLKVAIYAYAGEPEPADGINFSYPLRATVEVIEQTHELLYDEDDKKFIARNPRLMREAELAGAGRLQAKEPAAGKPN
jgi:hypothetical protein